MATNDDKIHVFLGTYTRSSSKGIYEVVLNRTTGKIEGNANLIIKSINHTYVVTTPEGYICI